jgi:putative membrane protein
VWDGIVAELVEHARRDELAPGFVTAIGRVGELLAAKFPVTATDTNELDDHLVEL